MTRYYTEISTSLVRQYEEGTIKVPEGWRLVKRWGPRYGDFECWIVEDDLAGGEFEDYLVTPVFQMTLVDDGPDYTVEIVDREIWKSPRH